MFAQFQSSYQRVEASLQKLTDSIAAYNPSTSAADELLAANEAVNENLSTLIVHQQRNSRIEKLRQTVTALDDQIKATLRLLVDARKEIQAIPSSDYNDAGPPRREVKVDELLSYAKFISKTTVPPTIRQPLPADLLQKPAVKSEPPLSDTPRAVNGTATPLTAEPSNKSRGEHNHPPNAAEPVRPENIGLKTMDDRDRAWLDAPVGGHLHFEPWPSHSVIQNGALARIQQMLEAGQDPASVLTAEEQAEEDRRKKEQEEKERVEQEERVRRRMSVFESGRKKTFAEDDVFNPDDL